MIEKGKVTINKKPAGLGSRVRPGDVVRVNGNEIENNVERLVYIALNKPVGISSTTDQTDKTNVVDFLHLPMRVFHIGRLDKDSEGLLLMTNDGNIVNKILRAGNDHEKEYEVWVDKPIENKFLEEMASGVKILGTKTKPCKIERETTNKFRITLTQGLNRQIRRMCEALGYEVLRLRRTRVMNITIKGLNDGDWRFIEGAELEELFSMLKDSIGTQSASSEPKPKPKKRFFNAPNKEDAPKGKPQRSGGAPKGASKGNSNGRKTSARPTTSKPTNSRPNTKSSPRAPKGKR